MTAFNDFEEKSGRFAAAGFLVAEWTDDRMAWNPGDFGQISSTQFPQCQVWTPTLVVWNTYARVRPFGFDSLPVRYNSTGDATWEPGNLFETSCDAQIRAFPFDVQTCTIDILPYGYLESEINFTASGIDKSDYDKNGMWDILSTDITEVDRNMRQGTKLMISIQFKRRSSYHVIHTLLPMIVMSILNILVFTIPIDGSNRIEYGITMLLTLSVFLTVVADTLPDSSLPDISYLSVLVLVHMMSSAMMLGCVIISFRLFKQDKVALRQLSAILKPCFCFNKKIAELVSGQDKQNDPIESANDGGDLDKRPDQSHELHFKYMSKTFDYACIVFFSLEVIVVNLFFFIITHMPTDDTN